MPSLVWNSPYLSLSVVNSERYHHHFCYGYATPEDATPSNQKERYNHRYRYGYALFSEARLDRYQKSNPPASSHHHRAWMINTHRFHHSS